MAALSTSTINTRLTQFTAKLRGGSVNAIVVRGASAFGIIKILDYFLAFGLQGFLARVMGAEHYGIYLYVITWLTVCGIVAKLGLDTTLLRYVATYKAGSDWGTLRGVLQWSTRLASGSSLVLSGLGALAVWLLQDRLGTELTFTFWLGCAALPVITAMSLREAALRSLRRVVLAVVPRIFLNRLILTSSVAILVTTQTIPLSGPVAIGLHLLAICISLCLLSLWLHRALPHPVQRTPPIYHSRVWFNVALPLLLISGAQLIQRKTDILMLGAMLDTTQAGIYAIASQIATLPLFSLGAASSIAAPMIAELYAQQRTQELQRMLSVAALGIMAFALPVGLGLIMWGKMGLAFFGPAFVAGYPTLVILVIAQLVNALAGPVGFLMTMTGHQSIAMRVMVVSMILNIILNACLIPTWGPLGAAIATAITVLTWNILLTHYAWQRLGLTALTFCIVFKKKSA